MTSLTLHPSSIEDYRRFLQIKALPKYGFVGNTAFVPDEYAATIGVSTPRSAEVPYEPLPSLFDYQRDIARLAITRRKFAVFADCGLGKTLIFLEFARHAATCLGPDRTILIVSPLMVIPQTIAEAQRFYGDRLPVEWVHSHDLSAWLQNGTGIGITNYEAMRHDISPGRLGALILDESSMLKSHYGKFGRACLRLGRGLEWKLANTGTPAPNDRIEYANHAVFMDAFPNVNAFLARYFVNRGQVQNRWELKPHALRPFYQSLSHWCIFLSNPATYGWRDNSETIPPIHVNVHSVPMSPEQQAIARKTTGHLIVTQLGGIASRSILGQLAKGSYKGKKVPTLKPAYIRDLVSTWPNESTIIWCLYNNEQKQLEAVFPSAGSITGETPLHRRLELVDAFKAGTLKVLISKPKILGFGLNLQRATRQVFSGLQDSYEQYYQAVKRSNRYGSQYPLNVHIPVTEIERPMIETVLNKATRVQHDTEEQERIFNDARFNFAA